LCTFKTGAQPTFPVPSSLVSTHSPARTASIGLVMALEGDVSFGFAPDGKTQTKVPAKKQALRVSQQPSRRQSLPCLLYPPSSLRKMP